MLSFRLKKYMVPSTAQIIGNTMKLIFPQVSVILRSENIALIVEPIKADVTNKIISDVGNFSSLIPSHTSLISFI